MPHNLNIGKELCSSQALTIIPSYVYNILMYSVKEAAEKLGLDTSQVRRLLAKGEIKGKKWGRDWMVLKLNYERKRKPGGGRKPKGGKNERKH